MSKRVVYMFHSIGQLSANDSADIHYNFSTTKFFQLLQMLGNEVSSIERSMNIDNDCNAVIGFDDGHISNYNIALELADRNYGNADFFINPSTIGQKDYMSWSQLKELDDLGMSIQSHGLDHVYFSDLSAALQTYQLEKSKAIIEDKLSSPVHLFAPPGGRFNEQTLEACHHAGYRAIAHSAPDNWTDSTSFLIPRVPVHSMDSAYSLYSFTRDRSFCLQRMRLAYQLKLWVKQALGNNRYDRFRSQVLGV
ncbi:MAG: polysaccharide deacetylase family protein [Pseudomonadales bacterium]|nr:polysaccharide deacetylase family protein [Pseudomonadales bacterium]